MVVNLDSMNFDECFADLMPLFHENRLVNSRTHTHTYQQWARASEHRVKILHWKHVPKQSGTFYWFSVYFYFLIFALISFVCMCMLVFARFLCFSMICFSFYHSKNYIWMHLLSHPLLHSFNISVSLARVFFFLSLPKREQISLGHTQSGGKYSRLHLCYTVLCYVMCTSADVTNRKENSKIARTHKFCPK